MSSRQYHIVAGQEDGERLSSRVLEERMQRAVVRGHRNIEIEAFGQHGLGGRLWKAGEDSINLKITGAPGQRVGSMGFPNTRIEIMGPASDDVGWLNAGAEIVVHGNATNGCANAMAQGKIYVGGNIGARGMTMTKQNPRFSAPELWVLGSVGDYFGEFMAGGIAVVCGYKPQNPDNILGYRPLVGMVGGKVFFRGPHAGYSQNDARHVPITEDDRDWLFDNLKIFLEHIGKTHLYEKLSDMDGWQLLVARSPHERMAHQRRSMAGFKQEVWEKELGGGGLIGNLTDIDRSGIPLITTGELRRFVPLWENKKYKAPCEATCPTGIPVHDRWRLVREGRIDEAVDLALSYTPFPASVCGYLCPNVCMQSCTRQAASLPPVDITQLGQASVNANLPELPPLSGKKIAVLGGGPAGISIAWQLRQFGHEAIVYDMSEKLGGKLTSVIPDSRLPMEVISTELERIREVLPHVHLQQQLSQEETERLREDFDFLVIAAGAQKPSIIPIPGKELLTTALDFLLKAKNDDFKVGERVVIIGAGNVGCDVATEAHRLGARHITLIDIQEPLSFGKEREAAEEIGAKFRYPCFTKEVTPEGVVLKDGELIPADTVFISVGDRPDLGFLPQDVEVDRGFIRVNEHYQTSDSKVFAVGDVVKPGLLTDAIGAGRKAAKAITEMLEGKRPRFDDREMIDRHRISLEYFDPRLLDFENVDHCGSQCSSCGACRDCGICVNICPQSAISRKDMDLLTGEYEYVVDDQKCIGCGFCSGACPCGIWNLVENEPLA